MTEEIPSPPIASQEPETLTTHGHTRIDRSYWLHQKENAYDYLKGIALQ